MKNNKTCIVIIVLLAIVSLTALAAAQGRRRGIKKEIWIPAAAFTASSTLDINECTIFMSDGYLTSDGINGCSAVAPVIFPKGAKKIMEVAFYAEDTNTVGGLAELRLHRLPLSGNFLSIPLGSEQTLDGPVSEYKMILSDDFDIIESGYVYYLTANIAIDTFLYGVKIIYK